MHSTPSLPADLELDELTRLELFIARRADELSRGPTASQPGRDCWFEAEREAWRVWFSSEPSQLAC